MAQLYEVWEQEETGSDWYVPICLAVDEKFGEWCLLEENRPQGLDRYLVPSNPEMVASIMQRRDARKNITRSYHKN